MEDGFTKMEIQDPDQLVPILTSSEDSSPSEISSSVSDSLSALNNIQNAILLWFALYLIFIKKKSPYKVANIYWELFD